MLIIVSKSHECNEGLDPTDTPGSEPEQEELFEANKHSCLVYLMLTSRLTWAKPLLGAVEYH